MDTNKTKKDEIIETKKVEIIEKIMKEIPFVDIKPYSHNLIGLYLNQLAEVSSQEIVKELVENTKLKDLGWDWILKED